MEVLLSTSSFPSGCYGSVSPLFATNNPPLPAPLPNTCWTRVFLNVFFAPEVVFRHFLS
jgi:hypothetical protein